MKKKNSSIKIYVTIVLIVLVFVGIRFAPQWWKTYEWNATPTEQRKVDDSVLKELGITVADLNEIRPCVWQIRNRKDILYGSMPFCKKITGYSGKTPIYILVEAGYIKKVLAGSNSETQDRFQELYNKNLFGKWEGMTLEQAAETQPDAISGATYSSLSVCKTVARTAEKVRNLDAKLSKE